MLSNKLAVAVLGLASTLAFAQRIDIAKEKVENPVGGTALVCAAIGMLEMEEMNPKSKGYEELKKHITLIAGVGVIAYGSQEVWVWKSTAATLGLKESLSELKNSDYGAYANRRAELAKTKEPCVKMYQWAIDPQSKS